MLEFLPKPAQSIVGGMGKLAIMGVMLIYPFTIGLIIPGPIDEIALIIILAGYLGFDLTKFTKRK